MGDKQSQRNRRGYRIEQRIQHPPDRVDALSLGHAQSDEHNPLRSNENAFGLRNGPRVRLSTVSTPHQFLDNSDRLGPVDGHAQCEYIGERNGIRRGQLRFALKS